MTCYDPSGKKAPKGWNLCTNLHPKANDGFLPCCQTGWTCLENRMCQKFQAPPNNTLLVRGGCTDPTFKSNNCPKFCLTGDWYNWGNLITDCRNGTGCCNLKGRDVPCDCQTGAANVLALGIDNVEALTTTKSSATAHHSTTSISTTLATMSTTAAATSTTLSSAPTSAVFASTPGPSDLSVKVIVPTSIIGGLALLLVLGIFLYRRFRYRQGWIRETNEKDVPAGPGVLLGG